MASNLFFILLPPVSDSEHPYQLKIYLLVDYFFARAYVAMVVYPNFWGYA
jgi:hypothetical protein